MSDTPPITGIANTTEPWLAHFIVQASAAEMPLGDPLIRGPRYVKSFETELQAHAWLEEHFHELRMTVAWVTNLDEELREAVLRPSETAPKDKGKVTPGPGHPAFGKKDDDPDDNGGGDPPLGAVN